MKKHFQLVFIFFVSFIIVYGSFLASEKYPKNAITSKASIFKTRYIPVDKKIVRVEINVYDNTSKDFYDVIEVKFNNQQIPLQKADASGRRARKYYQVKPGTYALEWKVSKSKFGWPRSTTHEKEITINPNDKFAYIEIKGEKASFSAS